MLHRVITAKEEYFTLVFKAMRADPSVDRIIAFVKRLLQMCLYNETNFTCATLLVINEVLRSRQDVKFSVFSYRTETKIK